MKVLIVDDQRSMRMISQSVVQDMGHETLEAPSGQEAIDACNREKVDLILMDVEMPGLSGFETAKVIREQNSIWFPIIFVSAKTDPKFFVEGIKSGGDIYLFKPIIPEVLQSMIKAMERIASYQEELHGAKIQMELLAHRDQLTGLVNRRGLDNAIELEFNKAKKDKSPLSIIMVDVDQFKPFNDNRGHQEGDDCLAIVGSTLQKAMCRPSDIVARYGGEEFVIILPNTDTDGALLVGERVTLAFTELAYPHNHSTVAPHVTVSGGIAELKHQQSAAELIKEADSTLYLAKDTGRNKIIANH